MNYSKVLYSLAGVVLAVLLWVISDNLKLVDSALFPKFADLVNTEIRLLTTLDSYRHIGYTIFRTLAGFGLAVIIGVPLGIGMGMFRPLYLIFVPIIDFFRSIPVTMLYPLFVLVLGVGDKSKIGMVFAACVFIIVLNSAYGVSRVKATRRQMASLYGCSKIEVLRLVTFFEALPHTLIGLRVALSLSLIVAVLGEMFMGAEYGLGQKMTDAYTTFAIDVMYAIILLTGLIGLLLNRIFVRIEANLVPWVGK